MIIRKYSQRAPFIVDSVPCELVVRDHDAIRIRSYMDCSADGILEEVVVEHRAARDDIDCRV